MEGHELIVDVQR